MKVSSGFCCFILNTRISQHLCFHTVEDYVRFGREETEQWKGRAASQWEHVKLVLFFLNCTAFHREKEIPSPKKRGLSVNLDFQTEWICFVSPLNSCSYHQRCRPILRGTVPRTSTPTTKWNWPSFMATAEASRSTAKPHRLPCRYDSSK